MAVKSRPTDIERDEYRDESEMEPVLYRCFSHDGSLLYIGVSEDVENRIGLHLEPSMAGRSLVSIILRRHYAFHTVEPMPSWQAARTAERAAIKAERPIANRHHNPDMWRCRRHAAAEPLFDLEAILTGPRLNDWFVTADQRPNAA